MLKVFSKLNYSMILCPWGIGFKWLKRLFIGLHYRWLCFVGWELVRCALSEHVLFSITCMWAPKNTSQVLHGEYGGCTSCSGPLTSGRTLKDWTVPREGQGAGEGSVERVSVTQLRELGVFGLGQKESQGWPYPSLQLLKGGWSKVRTGLSSQAARGHSLRMYQWRFRFNFRKNFLFAVIKHCKFWSHHPWRCPRNSSVGIQCHGLLAWWWSGKGWTWWSWGSSATSMILFYFSYFVFFIKTGKCKNPK